MLFLLSHSQPLPLDIAVKHAQLEQEISAQEGAKHIFPPRLHLSQNNGLSYQNDAEWSNVKMHKRFAKPQSIHLNGILVYNNSTQIGKLFEQIKLVRLSVNRNVILFINETICIVEGNLLR